jgi:hypothetical protein
VQAFPVGKIVKDKEQYLLISFEHDSKISMGVFVLDKKNKFLAAKEIMSEHPHDGYLHAVSINKEPTFTISREKMDNDKQQLQYTRIGWAYSSGSFIPVVNETNEDVKKNNTVLNPIDTFARKNKLSGNYVQNNKNFISVRDGKDAATYLFFIHFEKDEGTCIGELKGELKLKGANKAIYSENGEPCVVDFTFNGNELTVKEQGSCGNHRGIKCFFNDTYTKKKEAVVRKKK